MSIYKNNLEVSLFGESHGEYIGLTIHNFPHGIKLDLDKIREDLDNRHSFSIGKSTRREPDQFEIISGYFNGYTTGAPLTFIIKNSDKRSQDYDKHLGIIRPSHGDYTLYEKFDGFYDYRGGGHYSGRLTSLFVILGSICEKELNKLEIEVKTRIKSIYDIVDTDLFTDKVLDKSFPVVNEEKKEEMIEFLSSLDTDSVGGVVETKVSNVKVGLGNPIFDGVESVLSHLIFAIPAVKGIEFGTGFDITKMYGSKANDQLELENGQVKFLSNHSGGIQSGITNGEDIIFRVAIKPTPTISKVQKTINIRTMENVNTLVTGRHDKCIIPKVTNVINAVTAFAIYDLLLGEKNG